MNLKSPRWVFFILFICGVNGRTPSKIIGPAERVNCGQRSYQISLWKMTQDSQKIFFLCGGTILDTNYILTAAHCVNDSDTSRIMVGAGCSDVLSSHLAFRMVTEVYIHPEYSLDMENGGFLINDIAILTIDSPFSLDDKMKAIELPSADVRANVDGEIAGWGNCTKTSDTTDLSRFLLSTPMRVLPTHFCVNRIPKTQFCAMDPAKIRTVGRGDSGSPFVINNIIVGIVSHSYGSPHLPTYYTNVFSYLDFIGCVRHLGSECDPLNYTENSISKRSLILSACRLQRPYLVSIGLKQRKDNNFKNICSGVILDGKHILTAAHCLDGSKYSQINIGTECLDSNYQIRTSRTVTRVYIHPEYRRMKPGQDRYLRNDIAILIVDPPLILNHSLSAVKLPSVDVKVNQVGEISKGRVKTPIRTEKSETIMKIEWPRTSNFTQQQFYATNLKRAMPYDTVDSGSPFISNKTVVGIVSYTLHLPRIRVFCTNVFFHLSFIEKILRIL